MVVGGIAPEEVLARPGRAEFEDLAKEFGGERLDVGHRRELGRGSVGDSEVSTLRAVVSQFGASGAAPELRRLTRRISSAHLAPRSSGTRTKVKRNKKRLEGERLPFAS